MDQRTNGPIKRGVESASVLKKALHCLLESNRFYDPLTPTRCFDISSLRGTWRWYGLGCRLLVLTLPFGRSVTTRLRLLKPLDFLIQSRKTISSLNSYCLARLSSVCLYSNLKTFQLRNSDMQNLSSCYVSSLSKSRFHKLVGY